MACSGRATVAVRSHDPELLCTKSQVLHVQLCSVRSYCFLFLPTFQHLSGLYLSHILLTNTFDILLIFARNQSLCPQVNPSALLSPFFISQAGPPQTQRSFHGCSLCSVLGLTGIWCTKFARLTTLLQVAKQVPGPAQDATGQI